MVADGKETAVPNALRLDMIDPGETKRSGGAECGRPTLSPYPCVPTHRNVTRNGTHASHPARTVRPISPAGCRRHPRATVQQEIDLLYGLPGPAANRWATFPIGFHARPSGIRTPTTCPNNSRCPEQSPPTRRLPAARTLRPRRPPARTTRRPPHLDPLHRPGSRRRRDPPPEGSTPASEPLPSGIRLTPPEGSTGATSTADGCSFSSPRSTMDRITGGVAPAGRPAALRHRLTVRPASSVTFQEGGALGIGARLFSGVSRNRTPIRGKGFEFT